MSTSTNPIDHVEASVESTGKADRDAGHLHHHHDAGGRALVIR